MSNLKKYATTLLFAGIFVFCAGIFSPVSALAYTHTFTCADSLGTGSSCSSGVFTMTGSPWSWQAVVTTGTLYASYSYVTSGGGLFCTQDNGVSITALNGSHTITDVSWNSDGSLYFDGRTGFGAGPCNSNNQSGTLQISNFCVSDSSTGCDPVSPVVFTDFNRVFLTATSTAATSTIAYAIIDNPNQDFFNGILVFLIGMFGVMWFFSKKR